MGRLLLVRHGQASWGAADYDQRHWLRERMEAMGGQLTVERGSEFVLRARIPAAGLPTGPADSPTDDARESTDAADVQAKTTDGVTLPERPAADPTEERQ